MPTEDVQRFTCEEISGAELVTAYPKCACELTEPFHGGHGRIHNDELLSFFVESKRHIDLTKEDQRKKQSWAPKGSDLRNATVGRGHSVYRLHHAQPAELRQGAEAGHRSAVGNSTDGRRGIVGIFTFKAEVARAVPKGACGQMCIIDTPKIAKDEAKVTELSHADLLWSEAQKCSDDVFVERRRRFEDYMRVLLSKNGSFEFLKDFQRADLADLLPESLKSVAQLGIPEKG